MKKKSYAKICFALSVPLLLSSIGYGSWLINSKEESVVVSGPKVQDVPVAYILGSPDIKYTKIERALDVAKSGDIVIVIPPVIANNQPNIDKVTYKIERDCTIKEGVTLFIPTDKASEGKVTNASTLSSYIDYLKKPKRDQEAGGYEGFAENNQSKYLRVTVEIETGKKLTNNGTLLISGFLSGGTSNAGSVGQTSHSYSRIVLNQGSSIVQDNANAKTYCFGFIEESSLNNNSVLDLKKGELYIPVVINDYRGFNYSYAMTDGAINNDRCSVFNLMEFRNVKSLTKIGYNASVQGIINIYVKYDSVNVDQTVTVEKGVVGTTNKFLIKQTDPTYSSIEYKYNESTGIFKAKCYGGFAFNYLVLNLKVRSIPLNLSTEEAYFPLSYKFDVELLSGSGQDNATFNVSNQRMKILTGSKLYLGDNVTLSGNELIVYSAFFDGSKGNGQGILDSGRQPYPLKENGFLRVADTAKITMNKMAGTVFCNAPSNIAAGTKVITSKEPWCLGDSGSLKIPWTIKSFLEINEELSIVNTYYIEKKKICVGVNIFSTSNSYKPSFNLKMNDNSKSINVNGVQRVIFEDDIFNFGFELLSNIYTIFCNNEPYIKDSLVSYNNNSRLVCATNSNVSISNNNNGVNEFEVRSVSVACSTPLVNGEIPLYVNSTVQLRATVDDIKKSYDKTVVWSSSDDSVATIDQKGVVTGKKLGDVTIFASCGGVIGAYPMKVIPSIEITPISSITISDNNKNSATMNTSSEVSKTFTFDNKYSRGKSYIFTLKLNDGAKWSNIEWKLKASKEGRQYINDKTKVENIVNNAEQITLHIGDAGADDDGFSLTINVTELGTGKVFTVELNLVHKGNGICIVQGTKIFLADGSEKTVESLNENDVLLAFDHEKAVTVPANLFFNYHQNEDNIVTAPILKLSFENGKDIEIHVDHGFYDYTRGKYFYINVSNYKNFIGDEFVFLDKYGKLGKARLLKGDIKVKTVRVYSPVSVYHLNVFVNRFLSITGEIEGWFNYFDHDANLKYDEEKMKKDIEKYGLYEYEDFKDYIRKEIFDLLPIPYLKVSVGKGLTTEEKIIQVMKKYLSFM